MYTYQPPVYVSIREKLLALLQSKRFIGTAAGILIVIFGPKVGLDEDLAQTIVMAIVAAIVGDSINPVQDLLRSRRFWAFAASVVGAIVADVGLEIPMETVQQVVLAVAAWIIGDSWRVTMVKKRSLPTGK